MLETISRRFDTWLWRCGIWHPVIGPLLRNELLLTFFCLLCGGVVYTVAPWFFWFGVGSGFMSLTFLSLARFFLRTGPSEYSTAFLCAVLLRWVGRLIVFAALLYTAMIVCKAPVTAILGGLTAAAATALATYALAARS